MCTTNANVLPKQAHVLPQRSQSRDLKGSLLLLLLLAVAVAGAP
jgi:hypothetical protein